MTDGPDGLLIVDKPSGWTSHDVVARTRRLCQTRRVGHAGTLDPMATGVLVLGVNRATKLLTFLVGCDKAYTATIRLGQSTLTDDAEGEATGSPGVPDPVATRSRLADAVAALTGEIQQVPSSVSAIKVKGVRSYTRVRVGEDVELAARPVTVSRFDVTAIRSARASLADGASLEVLDVDVEVEVSSGTYIRALARDLGAALGTGGHLIALRRTRVGGYGLGLAVSLTELEARRAGATDAPGPVSPEAPGVGSTDAPEAASPEGNGRDEELGGIPLIPLAQAASAHLPVHLVTAAEAIAIGYGQRIPSGDHRCEAVAAIDPDGDLVAVLDETRETARPKVVFRAR